MKLSAYYFIGEHGTELSYYLFNKSEWRDCKELSNTAELGGRIKKLPKELIIYNYLKTSALTDTELEFA